MSATQHNSRTNDLPPIWFHSVHSKSVRLSADGTIAFRNNSDCESICFSNRPILVNEKVCIKLSGHQYSIVEYGFTTNDPNDYPSDLSIDREYVCHRPGKLRTNFWLKSETDYEIFFYVNELGEMRCGIYGEERGTFTTTRINTDCPFWAYIGFKGKSVAIVSDPRQQVNQMSENDLNSNNVNSGNECKLCYDQPIDSALYKCGHVCMCYECAVKQWRGWGQCPICRAVIKDVIRTYKS